MRPDVRPDPGCSEESAPSASSSRDVSGIFPASQVPRVVLTRARRLGIVVLGFDSTVQSRGTAIQGEDRRKLPLLSHRYPVQHHER